MKKLFFLSFTAMQFAFAQSPSPCSMVSQDTTHIGTISESYGLAIQSDHKIVVAGSGNENLASQAIAVLRYLPNQSLDNSFGAGGKVFTDLSSGKDVANDVVLQANGKILVAGYSQTSPNNTDVVLLRYNTDGTLDNTFGTNGVVTTDINGGDDAAEAMALDVNGKIVIAGHAFANGGKDFLLARYNSNGTLDNTFGTNGKVLTSVGSFTDRARALVIQSDGKLLVSGAVYQVNTPVAGDSGEVAVVRYETNGNLDNTFGTGGKVMVNSSRFYLIDGHLCNSLNHNGHIVPLPLFKSEYGSALALQSTGKIVVANAYATYRLNTNGSFDPSFTSNVNPFSYLRTLIALPNDNILAVGDAMMENVTDNEFSVYPTSVMLTENGLPNGCEWYTFIAPTWDGVCWASDAAIDGNKAIVAGFYRSEYYPLMARPQVLAASFAFATTALQESNTLDKFSVAPNPLAAEMKVSYSLSQKSETSIVLYDMFGRKVHTFMEKMPQAEGEYTQYFEVPAALADGMYVLLVNGGKQESQIKVVK